jgi:hypothetical protein
VLDAGDLEAPDLGDAALDDAAAAGLGAALAAVAGALAAKKRVVRVDVPAGGAGEGQVVDGDPLDLALDGDEEGAYVGGQLEVRDLLGPGNGVEALLPV